MIKMKCVQCGRCCAIYGHGSLATIGKDEYSRFKDRPDIQAYCFEVFKNRLWDIWVHPNGYPLRRCKFLRKKPNKSEYSCQIYELRPDVCRNYPVDYAQKIKDKCEGILEFKMKNYIRFSQVIECEKTSEVNKLLADGWFIIETIPITYQDGGGFIRTMMGNPSDEKIEYNELMEYIGRTKPGTVFNAEK